MRKAKHASINGMVRDVRANETDRDFRSSGTLSDRKIRRWRSWGCIRFFRLAIDAFRSKDNTAVNSFMPNMPGNA